MTTDQRVQMLRKLAETHADQLTRQAGQIEELQKFVVQLATRGNAHNRVLAGSFWRRLRWLIGR